MKIRRALKPILTLFAGTLVFLATAGSVLDEKQKAGIKQFFQNHEPAGTVVKEIKIKEEVFTGTVNEFERKQITCTAIVTIKDAAGNESDKKFKFFISVEGKVGARNEPYKVKCDDPLLYELPADATNFSASFSGGSGAGPLLVQGGLGQVATGTGDPLIAEPGTQLVLLSFPDDMPADTYDMSLDFNLGSTRPITGKPVLTAEASCGGQTIYPPMIPPVGSMGEAPAFQVPVSDDPVTVEAPLGNFPDEGSATLVCPCSDRVQPSCALTGSGTDSSGQKYIQISVSDAKSGLDTIVRKLVENAAVDVPVFTPGTNDTVIVTATKLDPAYTSRVELEVTDRCDNVIRCDPAVSLVVRENGKPERTTLALIPREEHFVHVYNGDPGVRNLLIIVNGERYRISSLKDGDAVTLDIAPAMLPAANIVTIEATGKPGGSALIVVSD